MKNLLFAIALTMASTLSIAQGSVSWAAVSNVAANNYGNAHPRMVLDGSGNPLVLWGRTSDQSVFFSRWTGSSFSTPVKLNPSWLLVATASWMGPDIASKGDTVYVVMKRVPEASDTNHIYIMSSFNGGLSFSSPVQVDNIADSISRFPTADVDPNGNPVVAFMKFNSAFGDSRWVVTRSADYGNTFSPDIKVSGWSGPAAGVCDCCPGGIVSSGNVTSMLYRDNLSNLRDIWTGISTDNNLTYNSGFAVDNSNWVLNSCPASGPDGVIIGDSLYTVYLSGAGGTYRTYLSKSSISNSTLNYTGTLTGSISGLNQQNFPRIATDGSAMAIVWRQVVSGVSQLPILFTNDISAGFPPTFDTVDLDNITNADVEILNGNVFVVWQDDNSGTVRYRSGTYTPATVSLNVSDETILSVSPNPVSSSLLINLPSEDLSAEILIFDICGKLVSKAITAKEASCRLDVSSLGSGMYFIRIISSGRIYTGKFIKD